MNSRERTVFLGIFKVFLNQCGHWHKKIRIPEHLKRHNEKVTFCISKQLYIKEIQEQLSECKGSRTSLFALGISEVQGVQEFQ